jgi:S1-C subfamily serine protease
VQPGDQIIEFDGMRVVGTRQFVRLVEETPIGRTVPLTILRNGQEQRVQVTLQAGPGAGDLISDAIEGIGNQLGGVVSPEINEAFSAQMEEWNQRMAEFSARMRDSAAEIQEQTRLAMSQLQHPSLTSLGMRLETMTPQLREFFGADAGTGVLIASVDANSPAANAGLQAGDVIIAADASRVDSPLDLTRAIRASTGTVTLTIVRDRAEQNVQIEVMPQR